MAFVDAGGLLDKAKVKYLEHRFYTIAAEIKRYLLKNGNIPTKSPVSKPVEALLEEFIIKARMVLPALGYKVLEPLPHAQNGNVQNDDTLYFSKKGGKGGKATGKLDANDFWVFKGSYIYPTVSPGASHGIKTLRQKYAAAIGQDGCLKDDISFGSPSAAAAFVCGFNINGLAEWKDKNGVSLKDISNAAPPVAPAGVPQVNPLVGTHVSFHYKNIKAVGEKLNDGFKVMKGSGISLDETPSCPDGIKAQRVQLFAGGKVKDGVLTEDIIFSTPSSAASCLAGASINGNKAWKSANGKPLK